MQQAIGLLAATPVALQAAEASAARPRFAQSFSAPGARRPKLLDVVGFLLSTVSKLSLSFKFIADIHFPRTHRVLHGNRR